MTNQVVFSKNHGQLSQDDADGLHSCSFSALARHGCPLLVLATVVLLPQLSLVQLLNPAQMATNNTGYQVAADVPLLY